MTDQVSNFRKYLSENVSAEFKLLLSFFDYQRSTRLERSSDFSFDRFLSLLEKHRIRPLIAERINEFKVIFTPEEIAQVKLISKPPILKQMNLTKVTFTVLTEFRNSGIYALPLKGQILSKKLFGSFSLRESKDVDLLINAKDLPHADILLKAKGFEPELEISNWQNWNLNWFKKTFKELEYYRSSDDTFVELHWSLFDQSGIFPKETRDLFLDAIDEYHFGNEIKFLNDNDEFLYLCMHGSMHGWFRLKWLIDIMQFLSNKSDNIDWDSLVNVTKRNKIFPALKSAIYLSHIFFDTPLPEKFRVKDQTDTVTYVIINQFLTIIIDDEIKSDPIDTPLKRFKVLNYDSSKVISYFLNYSLSKIDLKLVKLPPYLFWLYFPLRPFIIFYKMFILK